MSKELETLEASESKILETKEVPVGVPGPTAAFIFSTLCFIFWASLLGWLGTGATLAVGILQLGAFFPYYIAAKSFFKADDNLNGNIFFVFAVFFGFVGGLMNISTYVVNALNLSIDGRVAGIMWLLAAALLLFLLPAGRKATKVFFLIYLLTGIGLIFLGLGILQLMGPIAFKLSGWSFFVVGLLAFYAAISIISGCTGVKLPLGKSFF